MTDVKRQFFSLEEISGAVVIQIGAETGSLSSQAMSHELLPLLDEINNRAAPAVVLDFNQQPYFGSALLEDVLRIGRAAQEAGGLMALCNFSTTGKELIELARFHHLWPIFPSRDEALEYVIQNRNRE
jgi:anti-anti-sigma factor